MVCSGGTSVKLMYVYEMRCRARHRDRQARVFASKAGVVPIVTLLKGNIPTQNMRVDV